MKFLLGEFFASDEPEQKFCRHTAKLILRMGNGRDRDVIIFCEQRIVKPCDRDVAWYFFAKFTQRADDLHRNLIVVADHRIHRCLCLNRATDRLPRFHFPVLGVKPRHRIRIVQHPCLLYGSQKNGETLYKRTFH